MNRFGDEWLRFLNSPAIGLVLEKVARDPVLQGLLGLLLAAVIAIKVVFRRSWVETLFWALGAMILASFFVAGPGAAWLDAAFGPPGPAATDAPR